MNSKAKLFCLCCAGALVSTPSFSEVQSLSSSELTETYIKDSTIIVSPKQKKAAPSQKKVYSSLTIAPVENDDQDMDKLSHSNLHISAANSAFSLDEDEMRNATVDDFFNPIPVDEVDIPTYEERTTLPIADILGDERYREPEGDFDFSYIGSGGNTDLGLSRVGNQVTFSIGSPAGVPNPIEIPEAVQEGPMTLIPRPGGGFDLTIDVPPPLTE